MIQSKIRNIAIIAHVDHGKTTLVDHLLKQSHTFSEHQAEMNLETIMDSQALERERGVTILAKNTAVTWGDHKINILDTPGHSDFSGEVERVLNMAEGCVLLVDAAEGVLSQTKYVLSLALKLKLRPIVVINKVDRKDQRVEEVLEEINNLFLDIAEDDSQLEFPVLYAIGRQGIAGFKTTKNEDNSLNVVDNKDLSVLFQTVLDVVPAPKGDISGGFQMQITTLDYDNHKGRYVIGKINRGSVAKNQSLAIMRDGVKVGQSRIEYLFTFKGLEKQELETAEAGDIVAITGFKETLIGDTLTSLDHLDCLPKLEISDPTLKVQISVSTSPLVGKEGEFSTSRQLNTRLLKEIETNVSLKIDQGNSGDSFIVAGRGELHLAVLIETMRREGYEFSVSRPEVIFKSIDGVTCEPYEKLFIDVPEQYSGMIINTLGQRKSEMLDMSNVKSGVHFEYKIATRHMIGLRSEILTLTSGMSVISTELLGYEPKGADLPFQRNGVIVSFEAGQVTAYSLANLQNRGTSFVEPGEEVYTGMIIGLNTRKEDIYMNVCKGKKLTNMRASASDQTIKITPAVKMSLEQCITFIGPDELLEVTPKNLRLRKKDLSGRP